MNNKGQTTIYFSLIISVLFLFTLTALEVGRIHMSAVKIEPCVHSMQSSIMADYNEVLFERYHLLFMDTTYGTGSDGILEEKAIDYLETSLNGERGSTIYQYEVEELALGDKETILTDDMKLLKQQVKEYMESVGGLDFFKRWIENRMDNQEGITDAYTETDTVAVVKENQEEVGDNGLTEQEKETIREEYKDPRETLKEALQFGILALVAPGNDISKEVVTIEHAPSKRYSEIKEDERSNRFDDIDNLKKIMKHASSENIEDLIKGNADFAGYVMNHFSNTVHKKEDCVMACEVEYILKGKESDYENVEAVIEELTWWRMPMNYAYLLTDTGKKAEALTIATAISIVTGTEPFVEVIKYLLLGCWAYGESLQEMKVLLEGEKIPYIKTAQTWYTDLESLAPIKTVEKSNNGLSYEDCLTFLLLTKTGNALDAGYARMLDVIQLNLNRTYKTLRISDCVGRFKLQGKISFNPLFQKGVGVYDYYFEKEIRFQKDAEK